MKIGITYDLKPDDDLPEGAPDDLHEEFDSPVTIEAIASVLRGREHEVVLLGDGREFLQKVLADPPDLVFNVAEGLGVGRAREARVPAVLEMLGIPYTGSDPLTLALTLDKEMTKTVVRAAGVVPPWGVVIPPHRDPLDFWKPVGPPFPAIAKPAWEGSSKGIRSKCLVDRLEDLPAVVESLRRDHQQPILVEEFIKGDELTVGMLGNDPPEILGIMRVLPVEPTERFVYSLEVKRDFRRLVRYECPAQLPRGTEAIVREAAMTAWRELGCRDVARIDFRLHDGQPYFLEVNPLPGLNPESSDLVIMAGLRGWSHERLVGRILDAALARLG